MPDWAYYLWSAGVVSGCVMMAVANGLMRGHLRDFVMLTFDHQIIPRATDAAMVGVIVLFIMGFWLLPWWWAIGAHLAAFLLGGLIYRTTNWQTMEPWFIAMPGFVAAGAAVGMGYVFVIWGH